MAALRTLVLLVSLVSFNAVTAQVRDSVRYPDAADDPRRTWGQEVEGWQLSLQLDRSPYRAVEPLHASVSLRNAAGQKRWVANLNPVRSYLFQVILQLGALWPTESSITVNSPDRELPLTLYGQAMRRAPATAGRTGTWVPPRASLPYTLVLNRWYDMSLPGQYRVTVSCALPALTRPKELVTVISNPIPVEIRD